MSIWGKIVGGAAGFALGGPIGALVGTVAGHAVDKMRAAKGPVSEEQRQAAFSVAVIVLAAKMAKADGVVTRDEVDTFKRLFRVPPQATRDVGRLYDQAKRAAAGYEPYARQVAKLFRDSPHVLEELLDGLFQIAPRRQRHPSQRVRLPAARCRDLRFRSGDLRSHLGRPRRAGCDQSIRYSRTRARRQRRRGQGGRTTSWYASITPIS